MLVADIDPTRLVNIPEPRHRRHRSPKSTMNSSTTLTALLLILPIYSCLSYQHPLTSSNVRKSELASRPSSSLSSSDLSHHHLDLVLECRSNATHIAWSSDTGRGCTYQLFDDVVRECVIYLRSNIMPFDIPNLLTLGFPPENQHPLDGANQEQPDSLSSVRRAQENQLGALASADSIYSQLPDGLSDGIVNKTVHLALATKVQHPWTDSLPRPIFEEYVLTFVCANESRTNWRPLFAETVGQLIKEMPASSRVEDFVFEINQRIWTILGKNHPGSNTTEPIFFKAGQTPLIFDPFSVLAYGYASCTGMSILLVFALRAAGIPARLAGTPAWNGSVEQGNHSWVEVWTNNCADASSSSDCGGIWRFLESTPGDGLEKDPRDRWFCNEDRFSGKTKVYATRYDRTASKGIVFPLSWDTENKCVVGDDRSVWYNSVCGKR